MSFRSAVHNHPVIGAYSKFEDRGRSCFHAAKRWIFRHGHESRRTDSGLKVHQRYASARGANPTFRPGAQSFSEIGRHLVWRVIKFSVVICSLRGGGRKGWGDGWGWRSVWEREVGNAGIGVKCRCFSGIRLIFGLHARLYYMPRSYKNLREMLKFDSPISSSPDEN